MMKALSDLELAALLCSRVCHDVISPVGAIANGLEILAEETDEDMRDMAFDLVRRSADQASAKLQFCRLAFGAAGSAGSKLDLKEAGEIDARLVQVYYATRLADQAGYRIDTALGAGGLVITATAKMAA